MIAYRTNHPQAWRVTPQFVAERIRLACKKRDEAPSHFGRRVANDSALYLTLRRGRKPRAWMLNRIILAVVEMEAGNA